MLFREIEFFWEELLFGQENGEINGVSRFVLTRLLLFTVEEHKGR